MNAIPRRIFRAAVRVAAIAGFAMLAACSLTRPAPVKGTYLLEPAAPAPVARTQPGTLRIGVVTVGAPFRGRSFIVRESETKYEADFYHEFLVAPAANIADATARVLTAAKAFSSVIPGGVAADADWVLDAFVGALYADARDPGKTGGGDAGDLLPVAGQRRLRRSRMVACLRAPRDARIVERARLRGGAERGAGIDPGGTRARVVGGATSGQVSRQLSSRPLRTAAAAPAGARSAPPCRRW